MYLNILDRITELFRSMFSKTLVDLGFNNTDLG